MNVFITVVFDDERDREVLRRLRAEPKGERAEVIRQALREHYGRPGVTLDDVYRLLVELRKMGVQANATVEIEPGEPEDLADALDTLGTT